MPHEPWRWSATKIATAIQEQDISSREVIQSHLDRIGMVNNDVNAITAVLIDDALASADAADAAVAAGNLTGPLHGVPITVKENIDVQGTATTQGLVSRKNWTAKIDAPVIRHLKSAGAIILGRTNMPDFGLRWHTDNDLHGPTRNPWNPERTPGGSSGGEAAAIATGMSPLGIGNDMGGSTRQPAVNCGICGLRPTTGRVSSVMSSLVPYQPTYYEQIAAVNGPMARKIGDLRLALEVMSKFDPTDPIWTPAVAPPLPFALGNKIGMISDPSGDGVAPAVIRALDAAATALTKTGYLIEEIDAPYIEQADQVIDDLAVTGITDLQDTLTLMSADASTVLKAVLSGVEPDTSRFQTAITERHKISVAWCELMVQFPLILGPVSTLEPFEVGYDTGGPDVMRQLIRSFRLTELCNLLGLPSVALPASVEHGLPIGVQIIGRQFDELRCLDAAEVIEKSAAIVTPIDPVKSLV